MDVLARVVLVVAGCAGESRSINLTSVNVLVFRSGGVKGEEGLTAASHPAGDPIIVESVNAFEVPGQKLACNSLHTIIFAYI